jgi:hypothetical protein
MAALISEAQDQVSMAYQQAVKNPTVFLFLTPEADQPRPASLNAGAGQLTTLTNVCTS